MQIDNVQAAVQRLSLGRNRDQRQSVDLVHPSFDGARHDPEKADQGQCDNDQQYP